MALLFFLLEGQAHAADALLVLQGRVVDENGLPVAGAQVKLEALLELRDSASGAGPAKPSGPSIPLVVSDEAGAFSVPDLPAGKYKLQIEKPGFFVLSNQTIQLTSESTDFTFTLNHEQEIHERVDVTAANTQVDPTSTASTAQLTATEIRDVPVPSSHDLQQSLAAMPQVLRDNQNQLHLAGARNTDVQYLLDGVEVGDPATGGLTARLVLESVRNVETMTGRFGAEYAHPGAAVMRFDTQQGDDRWRFGATDFIPGITVYEGVHFGDYYPRVFFSGPLVKDTLWFSQSFDVLHTLNIVQGLPSGENESEQWGGDSLSRLLWRMSQNNSLYVNLLYNVQDSTGVGLDVLHPMSTTLNTDQDLWFGAVKEQSYFHKTLVEIGFAAERSYLNAQPLGAEPYVQLVDGATGNYFARTNQHARRYQVLGQATSAPLHWHGTHTISGGANVSEVELAVTASHTEIQSMQSDGTTLARLTTFTGPQNYEISNVQVGAFVQDSWTPDKHWVVSAGVRTDWDRLLQAGLAEPRVSVNLVPFADDRAKFSAGWGIYNQPLNLSVIGQTRGQQELDTLYNYGSNCPPPLTACTVGPVTSAFVMPPSGLQQPYFDITSVGWQQRFKGKTLLGAELLIRQEHHGLVYKTLTPGLLGSDFLLSTERQDLYYGATVSARHTFSNGTVLYGSYTWSKAKTNQVLDPVLGQMYFIPQQPGPLAWDSPNRFVSWGSIPTPLWGILLTYLLEVRNGYPYSAVNEQQFLVGAPNSYWFPTYGSLTLGFEKKFSFSHWVFAGRLTVVNVFNRQNANQVVNNVDAPNFGTFAGGQGRAFTARLRFVGKK